MKKTFSTFLLLTGITSLGISYGNNPLNEKELKNTQPADSANRFIMLFNGKDFSGWHTYGDTKVVNTKWKIEDGTICFDPSNKKGQGGDIVTNEAYDNFHLKIEWKIVAKSNSGIIFYVNDDIKKYSQTYTTGLEMQVLDNDGHPDGKITKHRAGDLYDLIESKAEPVKQVGQWNLAEIISQDGNLTFILNGIEILHTTLWDDNWKDLIKKSKFASWADFGSFKNGKIALQDHGDKVWFKNIMIKKL